MMAWPGDANWYLSQFSPPFLVIKKLKYFNNTSRGDDLLLKKSKRLIFV